MLEQHARTRSQRRARQPAHGALDVLGRHGRFRGSGKEDSARHVDVVGQPQRDRLGGERLAQLGHDATGLGAVDAGDRRPGPRRQDDDLVTDPDGAGGHLPGVPAVVAQPRVCGRRLRPQDDLDGEAEGLVGRVVRRR